MAPDIIRPFYEHVKSIGHIKQLDLVIYSAGGDTMVPWRLTSLIREHCERFCVIVPYRALSAATLLALGADEIVMGPMAELSPIDPSIGTPYNPPHPDNPNEKKLEIPVEDLIGYFNLAKERVGISDQTNLVQVFNKLVDRLHPLAIGAVHRSHSLIRLLAGRLLALHMKSKEESQRISKIVDDLAEKLFYHSYLINRHEAKELGLKVTEPSEKIENLIWELYLLYEKEMELGKYFDPSTYTIGKEQQVAIAFIESEKACSKFLKNITVTSVPIQMQPGAPSVPFAVKEQVLGWVTEMEGQGGQKK